MAVNPAVVKAIAQAATDKRVWKAVLYIVLIALGIIAAILIVFSSIISGLLGIFVNADIQQSWHYLTSRLNDVFNGMNTSINTDIKDTVYDFMPEFSVNLSKACINSTYDGSYLIMYDTAEIEEADSYMTAAADELRMVKSEDDVTAFLDGIDAEIILSFSDIENDSAFLTDSGISHISEYDEIVHSAIFTAAQSKLNKYNYEYVEFTTEDDRYATRQTLTVNDGDEEKIVEYICIGGGEIYIPEFMAMYQTFSSQNVLMATITPEQGEKIDEDIADAVGSIPETEEEMDEYYAAVWDGVIGAHSPHNLTRLNIFETTALTKILADSLKDGLISVTTDKQTNGNTEKLTITMEAPGKDTWRDVFEITDELEQYCVSFQRSIELCLDSVGIPEEERTLSLDGMIQDALFCYFEGFFNLPVESTDLKSGTNGMLTVFGQQDILHCQGMYNGGERGVTLQLENPDTPVRAELLPVGDCVEECLVYDVWDMEENVIQKDIRNYCYNYSAVTLAYYINVDVFEEQYGFPFPTIVGANGRTVEQQGGYVTLLVEYSCLDSLNRISELDIGYSVDEVYGSGDVVLGYCHNGELDKQKDLNTSEVTHYHDINFETVPHVCVKTYFCEGYLNVPEVTDPHVYGGLAVGDIGTKVNPRLWFKAFRTDLDEELYNTIAAIEP